ncbi:MAG: YciI family protein [Alphaproteobacteria bacterium]
MLFVIRTRFKAGTETARDAATNDHRAHFGRIGAQIAAAGPTLAADGDTRTGALYILDFADLGAAKRFMADDPNALAGVYASVEIDAWKKAVLRALPDGK